jgi:hypothetical protein
MSLFFYKLLQYATLATGCIPGEIFYRDILRFFSLVPDNSASSSLLQGAIRNLFTQAGTDKQDKTVRIGSRECATRFRATARNFLIFAADIFWLVAILSHRGSAKWMLPKKRRMAQCLMLNPTSSTTVGKSFSLFW